MSEEYARAKDLIRIEKYGEGLEILEKLVETEPTPETLNDMGVCYYLLGDSGRAMLMFSRAFEKAPDFAPARINRLYLERALDLRRNNDLTFRTINHDGIDMNGPKPRVSVIVRTYNRPDLLKEALASLKSQTFKDFETIVINDGGTDEAEAVCQKALLPGLRYFKAPRKGQAAALNRGLEMARGNYIAFLDDDDILYPNHLGALLSRLEKAGKPGVAYSDIKITYFDQKGKLLRSKIRSESSVNLETILRYVPFYMQVMVSRECFEKVGQFMEPLLWEANDWEMWIRIAKQYDFYHLPELTNEHRERQRSDQTTRRGLFDKYYYANLVHYLHQGISLFSFPKFPHNEQAYQIAIMELGKLIQKYPGLEEKIRLYGFYYAKTVYGYFYERSKSLKEFGDFEAADDFLEIARRLKPLEPRLWTNRLYREKVRAMMLWFKKKNGPLVAINQKPRLYTRSPYFSEQFIKEAKRQGRKIVYWGKNVRPDIILMNDWTLDFKLLDHYRTMGVKVVLRIDGAGVKVKGYPEQNNRVYNTFLKSNAVVFQSEFCKQVWEKAFPLNIPSTIIYNGADEFIFSRQGPKRSFGFKHLLVTAARWRPWKGLDQVIEIFLKLGRDDLGLVILGDLKKAGLKLPSRPRIVAPGKFSHQKMAEVFRAAKVFVYLPWQDWCPKVVVQALVSGLPVVCSFRGGTRELVQECGVAVHGVKDDELDVFEANPVSIEEAVNAVNLLLERDQRCRERQDLYLSTMVRQYYDFFVKLLDKGV